LRQLMISRRFAIESSLCSALWRKAHERIEDIEAGAQGFPLFY
jgi:hypothetical protein